MKVDKKEFFQKATLCICKHLEIEKALAELANFLKDYIPISRIYVEMFDPDFSAMRVLAKATERGGETLDLFYSVPEEYQEQIEGAVESINKGSVMFDNNAENDPLSLDYFSFLKEEPQPQLVIPLQDLDIMIGITIFSRQRVHFTEEHCQLMELIKEPLKVAVYNAIRNRKITELKNALLDDNRFLNRELQKQSGETVVGERNGLRQTMTMVRQVAPIDSPVLLLGETGAGKDVIASTIHSLSQRKDQPYITVNCGAIPGNLIDSELFGHEKGAFTGALSQKRGRFERANKGTIFLDEIGELPLEAQVRLLRVLQNREIERVGGTNTISLDIRIIAATNRDLEAMVQENLFREDLWFRLNVFPITIPPLRERKTDIPELVDYFIKNKVEELKLPQVPKIDEGSIDNLIDYAWPGNVRELQNVIERALILSSSGSLSFNFLNLPQPKQKSESANPQDFPDNLDQAMANHINHVLLKANGRVHGSGGAAELLGMNPNTLRARMRKLNIKFGRGKDSV